MPDRTLRVVAVACGIGGGLATISYLVGNYLVGWPPPGSAPDAVMAYALAKETLFYAGAWFQASATLLIVAFVVALVVMAGSTTTAEGLITIIGAAALLSVVLTEAAFLIAIPQAARVGDKATVSTAFAFTNDVFIRVGAIAPEPAIWLGLAVVLRRTRLVSQPLVLAAIGLGVAFEVGGLVAIVADLGVIILVLATFGQGIWSISAAARLWRAPGP